MFCLVKERKRKQEKKENNENQTYLTHLTNRSICSQISQYEETNLIVVIRWLNKKFIASPFGRKISSVIFNRIDIQCDCRWLLIYSGYLLVFLPISLGFNLQMLDESDGFLIIFFSFSFAFSVFLALVFVKQLEINIEFCTWIHLWSRRKGKKKEGTNASSHRMN